jgi:hypothetical protein
MERWLICRNGQNDNYPQTLRILLPHRPGRRSHGQHGRYQDANHNGLHFKVESINLNSTEKRDEQNSFATETRLTGILSNPSPQDSERILRDDEMHF